jgi:hypothetical protein
MVCRYSSSLRRGESGDRIPVGMRFSAPVQNSLGAHPASCTMRTWSFQGVKWRGRGADQPPPSSAEVTNVLKSYLCHPPPPCLRRHFMGWHLYWQKFTPVWLFNPPDIITQPSLSIYLSHIAVDLSNNYKHEFPLRLKGKSPTPYSVSLLHFCYTLRSSPASFQTLPLCPVTRLNEVTSFGWYSFLQRAAT